MYTVTLYSIISTFDGIALVSRRKSHEYVLKCGDKYLQTPILRKPHM